MLDYTKFFQPFPSIAHIWTFISNMDRAKFINIALTTQQYSRHNNQKFTVVLTDLYFTFQLTIHLPEIFFQRFTMIHVNN
jgi:hypothetical protein